MTAFTASILGFIIYDPQLFLEYSKYPLFLFANVATHNNFRNDPYNDKLSYALELFIYWTFMFNKGILLTVLYHNIISMFFMENFNGSLILIFFTLLHIMPSFIFFLANSFCLFTTGSSSCKSSGYNTSFSLWTESVRLGLSWFFLR